MTDNSFPLKEEFSPSATEIASHLYGLRKDYAHNKQVLYSLSRYVRMAQTIRRELPGYVESPEFVANTITAQKFGTELIKRIQAQQVALETEMAQLVGQLKLETGAKNE